MRVRLLLIACAVLSLTESVRSDDWPRYRGPTGMGLTTERGLPTTWNAEGENVLWKSPLPGTVEKAVSDHNQSSPIVTRNRVFVAVSVWPEGRAKSELPDHHVASYDALTGKRLWDTPIEPGPWKLTDLRGGYGAPTPATDGERVYVVFGSSVVAAVDFTGKLVWRHDIADHQGFDVAIASSPIVYEGNVLLLCERNGGKSTLTAYDGKTGETRWTQKRPQTSFSHSTPVVAQIAGRSQLLVSASNALQGLDPATGEIQWWVRTPGDVTSPTVHDGLIYTDSGRGGKGVLVESGGTGDVTDTHIRWTGPQISEGLSSPVVAGGYLYRLHTPGVLKCFDLETGKEVYAKRLEGVSTSSCPVATPEGLVYLASAGKSFIVRAGAEYDLVATNDLGDPSQASIAVAGGRLYFKGQRELICVGAK